MYVQSGASGPPKTPMSLRVPSGSLKAGSESPASMAGEPNWRQKLSLVQSPSLDQATKRGSAEMLPRFPVGSTRGG